MRNCPACKDCLLAIVPGSKGKAAACRKCGYMGPTKAHQIVFKDLSGDEEE